MSRTIRCKNYELVNNNSWDRWGKKTALEFTTRTNDGCYNGRTYTWADGTKHKAWTRYLEHPVPMTEKSEIWHTKRRMHGESGSKNARTPGRWYRENRMAQNRMLTKHELNRYFQYGGEYEPMVEAEPRSHYWDWS